MTVFYLYIYIYYIFAYIQHNGDVSLEKNQRTEIRHGNKQNAHFYVI